jgi:hypothetical protein
MAKQSGFVVVDTLKLFKLPSIFGARLAGDRVVILVKVQNPYDFLSSTHLKKWIKRTLKEDNPFEKIG